MRWILLLVLCKDCIFYNGYTCKKYKVFAKGARQNENKCGMYAKDFSPQFKKITIKITIPKGKTKVN